MSPPQDSAQIRRQIGFFRKLLQRYTSTSTSILKDYLVSPETHQFDHLNKDELETLRQEISSVRKSLLNIYEKITKLHEQWSTLQQSDADETTKFDEYIAKYGDYRSSITTAVNQLEQLDYLMNALDQEFTKRNLHIPSDSSDLVSHDDNVEQWNPAPTFAHRSELLQSSPAAPSDPALLNFVDASILSKLELPTFDGNLLDYPEFSARFATLVDNKPQLDDTTKFSLLKSCLRGRALQSIQGLSLTAANYRIAVDILKTHYDDKVTMKHILFTKLAQLPACDPEGRHLPTLYNRMFSLVRQFCNGYDDSKETALAALLLNKLPARVRSQIYDRTSNSHNVTPSELLNLLTDIVRKDSTLLEIEYHTRRNSDTKHVDYGFHSSTRSVRPPPNSTTTRSTQKRHMPKKTGKSCPYCKSTLHGAMECNIFITIKQRSAQAKNLRLCYNCLSSTHITRECTSNYSCRYCSKKHHSSLCRQSEHQLLKSKNFPPRLSSTATNSQAKNDQQRFRPSKLSTHTVNVAESSAEHAPLSDRDESTEHDVINPAAINCSSCQSLAPSSPTSQAALMCTQVSLFNPSDASKRITVTAFLDSGSSKSYITDEIADRLNLNTITTEDIVISTFGSTKSLKLKCRNHNVGIFTTKGAKQLQVKSVPTLTGNLLQIRTSPEISHGDFTLSHCKPSILIGNDYFWDIILSDDFFYRMLPNGYRLLHTTIGDVIINEALDVANADTYTSVILDVNYLDNPRNHDELCELVSNFWKLETIGIADDPTKSDDDECLNYFHSTIFYNQDQNRYVVKLPFKSDPAQLPNNFSLAFARLRSQLKSLQQRPEYLERYHAVIRNQAEQGIIEEVPTEEISKPSHYLSHHGVVKKEGDDVKIRCVYDGSAKVPGQSSLNDVLYRGPVLLPDLTGILLRSRFQKILISSDIEKAFLMVGLNEDCRDFTRFLWLKDPTKLLESDNIVTYRFTRVPFGLVSSPFLLAGTIHYHLSSTATPLSHGILRNTYVDNVFQGVNTVEEGREFYKQSKKLFQSAGMNLRAYASNSTELNDYFEKNERCKTPAIQKLLGLQWDTIRDTIFIRLPDQPTSNICWTKRRVLKCIASIYDPMGLLSPATLLGKLFLQSLWKIKLSWDELIPKEYSADWGRIISSWTTPGVCLPRLLFDVNETTEVEYDLHVFTDASAAAYCATAYIVQRHNTGISSASLIISKSRLAPLNHTITIPRLELAAMMIGSKLLTFVEQHLDIHVSRKFLWTDSSVALTWIKCNKDLPVFVKNRVKVILKNTVDVNVKHIPGNLNPADIGTRGATIKELLQSTSWWKGPSFLTSDDDSWPRDFSHSLQNRPTPDVSDKPSTTCDESPQDSTCYFTAPAAETIILEDSRFSSWKRMVNTMIYVLLFITKKCPQARKYFGHFRTTLLWKAEIILFRLAQARSPPSEDHMKQLKLFLCPATFLWKSKGRIDHATLPPNAITPTFLPRRCHITDLFVLHIHQTNNHCGVNHTLTILRQSVWIPKGRTTVKTVLKNNCFYCKRYKAKPFQLPPFPVHPTQRVIQPSYPFENIGMDFFGPMLYRSSDNKAEKYWILLLTCLNTRAIYVDLVLNMTSQTVLHLLRRFIASIGCPAWILCDNAQAFKAIAECYSSIPDNSTDNDILDYCSKKKIQFKFIPSLSPWQGGIYEKMVDIFKKSYKHSLRNRLLSLDDIKTLLKETEAIVNTRPLTYISDEINYMPLRPIDFLRPYTQLAGPFPKEFTDEWNPVHTTRETLLNAWATTSQLLSNFWKRWTSEYLTSLREQYKSDHRTPRSHESDQPKKGDYVLIHDPVLDRGQWRIGQIVGSQDDFKRSVEIRLPSKRIITRPHSLVYKLEITPSDSAQSPSTTPSPQTTSIGHPMITRSKSRLQNTSSIITHAILLLVCLHFVTAIDTKCPIEINVNKTILFATTCASQGIAVARYKDTKQEKFCWFPLSCPNGAIQFESQNNSSSISCGKPCKCPAWSISCSFTTNWRTTTSTIDSIPERIRQYHPPKVCSFTYTPKCDTTKRMGTFNQIQLFDNNTLLVESLTISIQDYIDEYDFICIDHKGWIRRPARRITGTSQFCQKHKCHDNAQVFCVYDHPIAIFITSDSKHPHAQPVAIKAWGTVTKTFYGYANNVTKYQNHIMSSSSIPVQWNCVKGGVTVKSESPLQLLEACINNYCVFLKDIRSETILFPNSLIMYDYTIRMKARRNNVIISENQAKCKAHPICETLQCTFCWEQIYNTQCWTLLQMTYAIAFFTAVLLFATISCILLKIIRTTSRFLLHLLQYIISLAPTLRRKKHLRKYINRRQRKRTKQLLSCTLLILLHIHFTNGCSQFTSITASENVCTLSENMKNCTINQATMLTLQPLQQEVCLQIQDDKREHLGTIFITLNNIEYKCHKRIEFFSRDHELMSESHHRCYMAGSCTEDVCDNIKPTDILNEFSSTAKKNPGYTYCTPTCGCLTCGGCFLCHRSCLFHRIYARPTTSTIYTVFNCPSWDLAVTADITLHYESKSLSKRLQLTPGSTELWNHLRLTLISTTTPQLPILGSTFMSDSENIAIIKPAYQGQLVPHTAGQLQCTTIEDAKVFYCYFPSQTCKCTNGALKVSCICPEGNLKKLMEHSLLPQIGKNFVIMQSNGDVFAKLNIGSSLQLHVVMDNLKLVSQQHKSTCTFTTSDLTGCYSCISGAKLDLVCTTNEGETTALITCPSGTQIAKCNTRGRLNKLILHFHTKTILAYCNASCPGSTTNITIKGTLSYVNDDLIKPEVYVGNQKTPSAETQPFGEIINHASQFISGILDSMESFLLSFQTVKLIIITSVVIFFLALLSRAYHSIFPPRPPPKKSA